MPQILARHNTDCFAQLKEKDENLGSVKSELPHTASSLSDKEQLVTTPSDLAYLFFKMVLQRPQQKKVAIVPARRYPLAHQQVRIGFYLSCKFPYFSSNPAP